MLKKIVLTLTVCILISLTGCQIVKEKISEPPTPKNEISRKTPSPKVSTKVSQPKQLETIESDSEDIIDDIDKKDWGKAQAKINEMKKNMTELKPILETASVSSTLINEIQTAITDLEKQVLTKKTYESKVQANKITKYVPDIADSFKTPLPTDLGRLDYLGREIILNVEVNDWTSAKTNLQKIRDIWSKLKTHVNSTYKDDINKYDESINKLGTYIDKHDAALTKKEANTFLDKTDVLENDFLKQNAKK